jgi:hypothetical protein
MCYLHPVQPLEANLVEPCHMVPKCSRDHVYIFLVHGMDPLDYANLTGLRNYLQELGFHKTYYGQLYHTAYFDREISKVHQEDPEARFVLIGFSFGANMVRTLAQSARTQGIPIDLLVYLGGNTLKNVPRDQPENCGRIINILASGAIWHGDTMEAAQNISVPDVWHFGSPTHRATLEALARELAQVAAAVPSAPPPDYREPSQPPPETAPAPRPVEPAAQATPRDEWDFLKPVPQLTHYSPPPRR